MVECQQEPLRANQQLEYWRLLPCNLVVRWRSQVSTVSYMIPKLHKRPFPRLNVLCIVGCLRNPHGMVFQFLGTANLQDKADEKDAYDIAYLLPFLVGQLRLTYQESGLDLGIRISVSRARRISRKWMVFLIKMDEVWEYYRPFNEKVWRLFCMYRK